VAGALLFRQAAKARVQARMAPRSRASAPKLRMLIPLSRFRFQGAKAGYRKAGSGLRSAWG
jgi:hypothetical protein